MVPFFYYALRVARLGLRFTRFTPVGLLTATNTWEKVTLVVYSCGARPPFLCSDTTHSISMLSLLTLIL